MEPVRSTASTMSTGVDEHGLQAFACVETSKWLMPKSLANQVFVLAVPVTVSWFGFTGGVAARRDDRRGRALRLVGEVEAERLAGVLAAA